MEPAIEKERKSETTRNCVFETSIKVMSERGYHNTKIRDICKEAKISIGTFYNYFSSKSDIIFLIFNNFIDKLLLEAEETLTDGNSLDKLKNFFKIYTKMNEDTGIDTLKLILNPDEEWHGERWLNIIKPLDALLFEIIKDGQEKGEIRTNKSSQYFVDTLLIVARGVCYDWCVKGGTYNLLSRMEDLTWLVLNSMTADSSEGPEYIIK